MNLAGIWLDDIKNAGFYAELQTIKDGDKSNSMTIWRREQPLSPAAPAATETGQDAIRDALELLQGDERLDASAIKGLENYIKTVQVNGGTIGKGQVYGFIRQAVADGTIRGLVVSGPPGIGKSHGIEAVFAKRNLLNKISEHSPNYIVISGNASAVGLYKTLYDYRDKKHTVIFDDCDGILSDDVSLNLLKAALDSGSKRIISWRSESRALANDDIPNSFEFAGSVIFLTNVNFDRTRESKIKHHLNAIRSRCHYLDLEIGTQSDMMLRIKQVIRDGMLSNYHLTEMQVAEIQEYIVENIDFLHELSLRTVLKIADFVKATPSCWKDFAEATCLKRTARFKRKLEELAVNEESNETE
jgi:hypothetical protein